MINFKTTARAGAFAVSALLGASIYASAANATIVTLNPSGSVPALSADGNFNADSATAVNNALITINPNGTFTETGWFRINGFEIGGSAVTGTGLDTNYSIYGLFTASGTQAGPIGAVTSLTFQLFGDPGNNNTYPASGLVIGGTGDDVLLGTGNLFGIGVAIVLPPANDPLGLTLNAQTTFTVNPGQEGFFVSPNPFLVDFQLAANVTQNDSSSTCASVPPSVADGPCQITITSGAIDISFVVPEPASLGLLGTGLVALGAVYRRRRARAA